MNRDITSHHQCKNEPIQVSENVQIHEVGHSKRKYITGEKIQDLASEIFTSSGYGLTFKNIISRFFVSKAKAQLCLKNFNRKGTLFTASYLKSQGIFLISDTKPQQYFSMRDRSLILENLKKRKGNIPVEPTGVHQSTISPLSSLHTIKYQSEKAQSFLDVLLLLPFTPPYIHKLQLLSHIPKEYYSDIMQKENTVNRAKSEEEIIGRRHATYTYSPNGTVEIAIRSNDTPFRIATEEDVSIIFSVLGQVRDRMLFHVSDPKERAVPSIQEWTLKACDLNKDILISDKAQLALPNIQLKYADGVFRLYVKIMEDKAYYRSEESLTLDQILPEALDKIRHPYRSVEDKIDQLTEKINQLKMFTSMNSSPDKLSVLSPCVSNRLKTDDRWV